MGFACPVQVNVPLNHREGLPAAHCCDHRRAISVLRHVGRDGMSKSVCTSVLYAG